MKFAIVLQRKLDDRVKTTRFRISDQTVRFGIKEPPSSFRRKKTMRDPLHKDNNEAAARNVFARFASAWRRGAWISATVSRDFSRRPLVNDGWPLCR
jgi:hypothetical protein